MPLKFADLVGKSKSVSVDVDGEPVHLEVRQHVVTPNFLAELEASDQKANSEEVSNAEAALDAAKLFIRLVASWDVEGADGAVFPLDIQHLAEFPSYVLVSLLRDAVQALQPGEALAPAA